MLFSRLAALACIVAVASALPDLQAVLDNNGVVACDGFNAQLTCPPGTFIYVTDSFYGRRGDGNDFCPALPGQNNNCNGGVVPKVFASARCNYKQSCRLPTNIFGDPCPGTHKYLQVVYRCKAFPNVVGCDGAPAARMQCPAGKFIAIRDAFYGRVSDDHCAHGPRLNYACSLANIKDLLSGMCTNKQACAVGLLPDPCVGTLKYVTAVYECMDHQTQVACDGSPISISCPPNTTIRVLRSFFGRTSDEVCAHGPRLTYTCNSATAPQAIANMCSGKNQCAFQPSILGDPCPNTLKYAQVEYVCA